MLDALYRQFVQEKQFLKNVTPKTVIHFNLAWRSFRRHSSVGDDPAGITKNALKDYVRGMREAGLAPKSCNTYISGINSFLRWLYDEGHMTEPARLKLLKVEKKVFRTFQEDDLRRILTRRPTGFYEWRLISMLALITDTGIRITEALNLQVADLDFSNLLVKIDGKGQKERLVPFSLELRSMLYRYLKVLRKKSGQHEIRLLFPTRHGGRVEYHNMRRDFLALCDRVGVSDFEGAFHAFRRTFAKNYVRAGGNIFYLQQVMGHEDINTTRTYVEVEVDALRETHRKTSLLSKLR